MVTITYSGRSRPSAMKIVEASGGRIQAVRGSSGDINWGAASVDTVLNRDISSVTNKRKMRMEFQLQDVPMPYLYTDHQAHSKALQGKRLVGRPDTHTKGRGFWRVNSNESFMRALRGTRRKKAATHFMEFVEAEREYRVHIFNGKSIRISEKGFTDGSRKEYITRKPTHDVRHVREAAKRAVGAVGLNFGAVDILARGDANQEVFVLEVNSAPGLGGSMPALYANTFIKWKESQNVRNESGR